MAKYYKHQLDLVDSPADVPLAPLKGGKIAKSSRASAVFDGLDKVPALGRRIVYSQGMSGSNLWMADTLSPTSTINRVTGRTRFDLTPGCILGITCLHLPSGNTSGGSSPFGQVQLNIAWTDRDGDTTNTTHTLTLFSNAEGATSGEPWEQLLIKSWPSIKPENMTSATSLREWSRGAHVEITVSYNGNPRVVDLIVYERPLAIALEADDADDFWVSGMFSSGHPDGSTPNLSFPVQRLSETTPDGNRRGGTWQIMDQVDAQQKRLGPLLFSWTGHHEEGDSASVIEDGRVSTSAALGTWTRIPDGATSTDPTDLANSREPGWSVASGAYSRPPGGNHPSSMLNSGAIPVRVWIRISAGEVSTQDFEFRLHSNVASYIKITGTAPDEMTGAVWLSGYGWLACGRGPGQAQRATAIITRTNSADDSLHIYDIICEHARAAYAQ